MRGKGGRKKEERVPRLHGEANRQQGTAAAAPRLERGFHCIAIRKRKKRKKNHQSTSSSAEQLDEPPHIR